MAFTLTQLKLHLLGRIVIDYNWITVVIVTRLEGTWGRVGLGNHNRTNLPPPHTGLTRVEDITAVGVTFTKTLSFEPHDLKVANKAATCLFALKTLKAPGLQGQALRDVTLATLVAQLLYASRHGADLSSLKKKPNYSRS